MRSRPVMGVISTRNTSVTASRSWPIATAGTMDIWRMLRAIVCLMPRQMATISAARSPLKELFWSPDEPAATIPMPNMDNPIAQGQSPVDLLLEQDTTGDGGKHR